MNAMNDWKPIRQPGYTGDRHDDKPASMSKEQIGALSFVAGFMAMLTISLFVGV